MFYSSTPGISSTLHSRNTCSFLQEQAYHRRFWNLLRGEIPQVHKGSCTSSPRLIEKERGKWGWWRGTICRHTRPHTSTCLTVLGGRLTSLSVTLSCLLHHKHAHSGTVLARKPWAPELTPSCMFKGLLERWRWWLEADGSRSGEFYLKVENKSSSVRQ